jgi:glycyl-tRNA synthetase beta subunit
MEAKKAFDTVYIKFKKYSDIKGRKSKDIKHHTFTMAGDEDDIRKEIKKFIDYVLVLPYDYKIKIIRLASIKKIKTVIIIDGKEVHMVKQSVVNLFVGPIEPGN